MEVKEIYIEFAAHLRENYMPAISFEQSTHQYSTSEFLMQISHHYGLSFNQEDEIHCGVPELITALKEVGFNYQMVPGTVDFKWLLVQKAPVL